MIIFFNVSLQGELAEPSFYHWQGCRGFLFLEESKASGIGFIGKHALLWASPIKGAKPAGNRFVRWVDFQRLLPSIRQAAASRDGRPSADPFGVDASDDRTA